MADLTSQLPDNRHPSLSDIKTATLTFYASRRITKDDLEGDSRYVLVSHPRQVAMYLARALTTHSLPKIAKSFGDRHHTTALHATVAVERRPDYLADAEKIRAALEASTSPRNALAREIAACKAIGEFVRSLRPVPVERDFILIGTPPDDLQAHRC